MAVRKQRIKVDELVEAIYKANGLIASVARMYGVSTRTIYNYKDKYPAVANAIEESRETFDVSILDIAERKLAEAINNGEPWAVRYALDKKGSERGYIHTTRQEIKHINLKELTDEELEEIANGRSS